MKMGVPIRNDSRRAKPGAKRRQGVAQRRRGGTLLTRVRVILTLRAGVGGSVVTKLTVALALMGCTPQGDPGIGAGFFDDFERSQLGDHYKKTGGNWRIENGQLHVKGAKNHPLWLLRTLPRDVRVELDARSESSEGDIKVELFGDGASYAEEDSYEGTGYVIIFGGWNNSKNVLARMDEHGADRVVGEPRKVESGRTYHFRIERVGGTLTVWVDDDALLEMDDPDPLAGRRHDHFGFNNWQSDLWFDNLKVTPL